MWYTFKLLTLFIITYIGWVQGDSERAYIMNRQLI